MGETENSTFHDFWILGPVGTLIYGFEYTNSFNETKQMMGTSFKISLVETEFLKFENFES